MYKTHRTEGSVVPVAVRHVSPKLSRSHARNSERCAAAQRSRRNSSQLSSGVAKYGPPPEGSGTLPLEGSGTYGARQRVVTRYDDARPAEPPPWPPMWSQRPLQEDLSRYAENQPSCVRDVVVGKE